MNRMKYPLALLERQWLISGSALIKNNKLPADWKRFVHKTHIDWCWDIHPIVGADACRKKTGPWDAAEPLFWLHFFRARPTTFFLSRALKRTREHAKGHAMLCMCVDAPESPVAKTWSGERVSRSFRFLLRVRAINTLCIAETSIFIF